MAEKKPPVGKGAESDGQADEKKASTSKKAGPVKKATPKKKVAPKKKLATKKKPVPKKQAAKKAVTATTAESAGDLSKKPPETDNTITSVAKAGEKAPGQDDTQPPPPPQLDRVGRKITLWPWLTLFALVGLAAYLLEGPLRNQDDTESSAVVQQNQETSTTSLSNVHESSPVSTTQTETLNQDDEVKKPQQSEQADATSTTTSDDIADPDKLAEKVTDEIPNDKTETVQEPILSDLGMETEETTPEAEYLPQETPPDASTHIAAESISKPGGSNGKGTLPTTADAQARTEESDQYPQPPTSEVDSPALNEQAPETISSSQATLNDGLPAAKPEVKSTVSDGQANGPPTEVGHTQQIADDKTQKKITEGLPTNGSGVSSKATTEDGSEVGSAQAEAIPKGGLGMPVPEHFKEHPASVWGNYWQQNVPRQYLPAYYYNPYYYNMRQYPYNYYRHHIPFPAYRHHRPHQPNLPQEDNN